MKPTRLSLLMSPNFGAKAWFLLIDGSGMTQLISLYLIAFHSPWRVLHIILLFLILKDVSHLGTVVFPPI